MHDPENGSCTADERMLEELRQSVSKSSCRENNKPGQSIGIMALICVCRRPSGLEAVFPPGWKPSAVLSVEISREPGCAILRPAQKMPGHYCGLAFWLAPPGKFMEFA